MIIITNEEFNKARVIEAIGILPHWLDVSVNECNNMDEVVTMMEGLYGFPMNEMNGGTVDPKTGTYTYPDDPDMKPLAVAFTEHGVVYFYSYAMIAFECMERFKTYRMD